MDVRIPITMPPMEALLKPDLCPLPLLSLLSWSPLLDAWGEVLLSDCVAEEPCDDGVRDGRERLLKEEGQVSLPHGSELSPGSALRFICQTMPYRPNADHHGLTVVVTSA